MRNKGKPFEPSQRDDGKWMVEGPGGFGNRGPFDTEEEAEAVAVELMGADESTPDGWQGMRDKMTTATLSSPVIVRKRADKAQRIENEDNGNSVWILCTADLDRDGETVDPAGLDLTEFSKNPVFVDNHQTDGSVTDVILGKVIRHWMDEVGEGTKWPQPGGEARPALMGEIEWNRATQKGREAQAMAKAGQLNGGSVSFLPLGRAEKNGQGGNHYPRARLLEFTACSVPSNPSAIRVKSHHRNGDATVTIPTKATVEKRAGAFYVRYKAATDMDNQAEWNRSSPSNRETYLETAGLDEAKYRDLPWNQLPNDVKSKLKPVLDNFKGMKAMKLKRKLWVRKRSKSAWLLKSDGGVDSETAEYLKQRGLDDVTIADQPPPGVDSDQWQEEGNEFGHQTPEPCPDQRPLPEQADDSADAIAAAMKDISMDPAAADAKIDEALDDADVPVEMRAAVKGIIKRKLRKARRKASTSALDADQQTSTALADLQKSADEIAERAKQLMNKGADEEGAVAAACKEADVPEAEQKRMKRLVRKSIEEKARVQCPACAGTGSEYGEPGDCRTCGGRGTIEKNKQRADDQTIIPDSGTVMPVTESEEEILATLQRAHGKSKGRKMFALSIKAIRKAAEDDEEKKRKAAADGDQQTSLALADLQKSIAPRPALSLKNAKAIRKAAELIEEKADQLPRPFGCTKCSFTTQSDEEGVRHERANPGHEVTVPKSLDKLVSDLEEMSKAAGDGPPALPEEARKSLVRKTLTRKNIDDLEKAADELEGVAKGFNAGDQVMVSGKYPGTAMTDEVNGYVKVKFDDGQTQNCPVRDVKPKSMKSTDDPEKIETAKKLRSIMAKRGGAYGLRKSADGEQQTSLALADLQKSKAEEEEEQKRRKAVDPDAEEKAEQELAEKIKKNGEMMRDVMARQNKTNETLYRNSGVMAFPRNN